MRSHTHHLRAMLLGGVAAAALLLAPAAGYGQLIVIGFDIDPSGNDIADGRDITRAYSSFGVLLSRNGSSDICDSVYASNDHPGGDFGAEPNVVTLCPGDYSSDISENSHGLIRASFDGPVVGACIDVYPTSTGGSGVMRAYDHAGNLITESTSTPDTTETLCVSGERIRYVEFSGYGDEYAIFDSLSVSAGAGPGPAVSYIPGAANVSGIGGTQWNTDLEVTNRGGFDMDVRVELLPWNQPNTDPVSSSFTVPADSTHRVVDALDTLFGYTGAATLRVLGTGGILRATARTYNNDPSGTYGQYIAGVRESDGISPGTTGVMTQLTQSPSDDDGYRTNLGLANATGFSISVDVTLFDASGSEVGSQRYTLRPYEAYQLDRVYELIANTSVNDGYITVSSPTTEALFFAYASVVDNRSGDPIYVPATID